MCSLIMMTGIRESAHRMRVHLQKIKDEPGLYVELNCLASTLTAKSLALVALDKRKSEERSTVRNWWQSGVDRLQVHAAVLPPRSIQSDPVQHPPEGELLQVPKRDGAPVDFCHQADVCMHACTEL